MWWSGRRGGCRERLHRGTPQEIRVSRGRAAGRARSSLDVLARRHNVQVGEQELHGDQGLGVPKQAQGARNLPVDAEALQGNALSCKGGGGEGVCVWLGMRHGEARRRCMSCTRGQCGKGECPAPLQSSPRSVGCTQEYRVKRSPPTTLTTTTLRV